MSKVKAAASIAANGVFIALYVVLFVLMLMNAPAIAIGLALVTVVFAILAKRK